MKKKLIIGVVGLLVVGGVVYKMFLAPKPPAPKVKVEGVLFPLDPEFLINLDGGRFAKVKIALLLEHSDPGAALGEATPGVKHPQDSMIRSIITAQLTGVSADDLLDVLRRQQQLTRIKAQLASSTDVKVKKVLITDISVD